MPLNAFQSTSNSAVGSDVSVTVVTSTSTVVPFAYLEPPTLMALSRRIPRYLFVDVGTTNAPIIDSVSVVFNQRSTGTARPYPAPRSPPPGDGEGRPTKTLQLGPCDPQSGMRGIAGNPGGPASLGARELIRREGPGYARR